MAPKGKASAFPAARIKKIMQEDEDVGKLAQATPIAVSKAVELFIKDLVVGGSSRAQEKGSKKLTAYHIKRAVLDSATLDFLKPLVEKIPDPVEGAEGEKVKRKRIKEEGDEPVAKKPRKPEADPAVAPAPGPNPPAEIIEEKPETLTTGVNPEPEPEPPQAAAAEAVQSAQAEVAVPAVQAAQAALPEVDEDYD